MKFKPYGYFSEDNSFPPGMRASDFSNDHYAGIRMGKDIRDQTVLVMKSKDASPMPWSVCYGFSSVFFKTFREAMDFCNSRGMKLMQEAEDSRYE